MEDGFLGGVVFAEDCWGLEVDVGALGGGSDPAGFGGGLAEEFGGGELLDGGVGGGVWGEEGLGFGPGLVYRLGEELGEWGGGLCC